MAFKGTPATEKLALQRKMLLPQGLFGFEGLLLYQDFRVGWLAGLMKRICHFLLKEMEKLHHLFTGRRVCVKNQPYRTANAQLVEIFERMLGFAEKLNFPPDANWTQGLLSRLMDELGEHLEEFASKMATRSERAVRGRRTGTMKAQNGPADYLSCPKIEEISFPALKRSFPFRLATTSYIFPGEILPNIRRLGRYFDEVELVLFESGQEDNLPTPARSANMACLASDLDLTYNVDLPADLFFGDPDPALRRKFCETAFSFYERTLPLAPTSYICTWTAGRLMKRWNRTDGHGGTVWASCSRRCK